MARLILKSLMFLSSIATVFIGVVVASVANRYDAGGVGIVLGVGIALAGLHSAFDLYRTFYRQVSK